QRGRQCSGPGANGVEESDGLSTDLQWEHLAHRQVGRTRPRGGEEEDDRPADGLRYRTEYALHKQPAGDGKQDARDNIGETDHLPSTDRIKQPPKEQWPKDIANGK